jgi:hypothetical protein
MRRGFDGRPASTITPGSTLLDCRGEGSAVWVCAFTLAAVAITQASATLNPHVDERKAVRLESRAKVLKGISNVPQHSLSVRVLIVSSSALPSSTREFRAITNYLAGFSHCSKQRWTFFNCVGRDQATCVL